MIKLNNYIYIIFLCCMFQVTTAVFGQSKDCSACRVVVSTVSLQECEIIDEQIALMLDSAFAMLRADQIHGMKIPYQYFLEIDTAYLSTHKIQLTLRTLNKFLALEDYRKIEFSNFKHNYYVLNYKGYQLLVKDPFSGHIAKCLKTKSTKTQYISYYIKNEHGLYEYDAIVEGVSFSFMPDNHSAFCLWDYGYYRTSLDYYNLLD